MSVDKKSLSLVHRFASNNKDTVFNAIYLTMTNENEVFSLDDHYRYHCGFKIALWFI